MKIRGIFKSSKILKSEIISTKIGKYKITLLRNNKKGNLYSLRFKDTIRANDSGKSQPEANIDLFLAFLSLVAGSKIELVKMFINSNRYPNLRNIIYSYNTSNINEEANINILYDKIQNLDLDISRQYIRACNSYRTGLSLMGYNNNVSLLLFVTSIECLSNGVIKKGKKCDKYSEFIMKYLPEKQFCLEKSEFRKVLIHTYNECRSKYAHDGKEVPDAVFLADKIGRNYVKHYYNNSEVKTLGLRYLEKITRISLINYLSKMEYESTINNDAFKDISLEFGSVVLKKKRNIKSNTFVTTEDMDLD